MVIFGFCSYYRRFIPRFSEIAKPLHHLSEKGVKFNWSDECNSAFETVKKKIVEAHILEIKCKQEKDPDISLVKSWIKEWSKPEHKDIITETAPCITYPEFAPYI